MKAAWPPPPCHPDIFQVGQDLAALRVVTVGDIFEAVDMSY
jgi:hypothetical protein